MIVYEAVSDVEKVRGGGSVRRALTLFETKGLVLGEIAGDTEGRGGVGEVLRELVS